MKLRKDFQRKVKLKLKAYSSKTVDIIVLDLSIWGNRVEKYRISFSVLS